MRAGRLAAALLAAAPAVLSAQFTYFGQNKVQYRGFDWQVLAGPHVDVYFYPEERDVSRVALAYAESCYAELEVRFSHSVQRRIPLIVYASHADFEQTNILDFFPPEELLGVTDFLKRRVTLPFTGSYAEFRHTLKHELVHVFQLSLASEAYRRFPRASLPPFPLWFTEGLAEYFSAGEDARDEMVLRDFTVSGRLPSLGELAYAGGGAIYAIGGAAHAYLGATYGDWRVALLYHDAWKYHTFNDAIAAVYGKPLARLSDEWRYWMRQRYYGTVDSGPPLALQAHAFASLAIKPAPFRLPGDTGWGVLYFSPRNGYASIYASDAAGHHRREIVKGERTPEFESFHYWASRMDVNDSGEAVFSSRFAERDALYFLNLVTGRIAGRYQFPTLVSILSPCWAPDRKSVTFSGLTASGYSDLYRLWLPDGRLERLTADRYQDLDPSFSPDGRSLVFSSDRTGFGAGGAHNLFLLDLATGAIRHLTYGDWHDDGPRWARTGRIWFTSDRGGIPQLYSVDSLGTGHVETRTQNGAFDPVFVPGDSTVVFGGFADLSFDLYAAHVPADTASPTVRLAVQGPPAGWRWPEAGPADSELVRAPAPYRQHYSLDFAAAGAALAPGIGGSQGAVAVFTDILNDHQITAVLSSFAYAGTGFSNIFQNINASVFYLNQTRRINWGVGAFRVRGLFSEGDFFTQYQETSIGVRGQVRYPLDRFRRIEFEYRLEYSDRFDFSRPNLDEPRRVGWLGSNYVSFVKDNSLWLDTGPIDGTRYSLTGGVVNDLTHGRFDSWVAYGDVRHYFRTGLRSAFAVRAFAYYAGGERPRPTNIGGSWALRGYPYYGYVAGTRAWMGNAEWRFPLANFLVLGLPIRNARFPGVQGALFADVGRAWTETSDFRGALGSAGFGLRSSLGLPLVARLDFGWRFHDGPYAYYGLPQSNTQPRFVSFFIGYNY